MSTRPLLRRALRSASLLVLTIALLIFSVPTISAASSDTALSPYAPQSGSLNLNCKSAVLMDAATGQILYEQNPTQQLPPASVTKIMTLLLIMEAIDTGLLKLSDPISVSATAAGMGGSQVYLEPGEVMSCEDLLKSVVISSANDAAVALAEHIAGDIPTFVQRMNEKASALGMLDTHFENATGLDDTVTNHLTTAKDIAIMSRALIEHKDILQYSSVWMDTIRNGTFGLTNTNRLIRFYRGATGLKTGSTDKAGFCVSVTAQRDSLSLICVIMGAESSDIRNAQATRLLDWGFANFACYRAQKINVQPVPVKGGSSDVCHAQAEEISFTLPKNQISRVEYTVECYESVCAPVARREALGRIVYRLGDQTLGEAKIVATEDVGRITYRQILLRLLRGVFFA